MEERKMRKICVMLLAAVMGFAVVGCGEEKKAPPAAPKADAPKADAPKADAPKDEKPKEPAAK
jgi:hypothetical protein